MKRLLLLLFVCSCACIAQDGHFLYQQHCAMCHDAPKGRIPTVGALKTMSASAILNGRFFQHPLNNGLMEVLLS